MLMKKSKRVSWAPDEYLCEVKPVLETDSPFRIGTIPSLYGPSPSLFASTFAKYAKVYGNIWKEKKSKKLLSHDEEDPVMPPGFENSHNVDGRLKWKCPPKFDMCGKWKVMAGEESDETKAHQKLREMKELEVFYPRSTSIPHSTHICLDTENNELYYDRQTPILPMEEVKDEDDFVLEKPVSISMPRAGHAVAAYVAALTAILKLKNQRASIDTDFLAKILSNPQMIEKLNDVNGAVSSCSESALTNAVTGPMVAVERTPVCTMPDTLINNAPSAAATLFLVEPVNEPVWKEEIGPMSTRKNLSIPNRVRSSNPVPVSTQPNCFTVLQPPFGFMPAQRGPLQMSSNAAMTTINPTPTTDAHYYHKLIKDYGGNKQEMPYSSVMQPDNYNHNQSQKMKQVKKLKPVASKTKCRKRCRFYFGSATGCLNGSKCLYRHDILPKMQAGRTLESPRAKKRKLANN